MAFTNANAGALGTILEGIFYGAYMVLFILYLVLRRRNNRGFGGLLTLAQILLFGLCTISLCLDLLKYYFFYVSGAVNVDTAVELDISSLAIFVVIDYLAQMILLYRCWIVWNRQWVVVVVPGFLALVSLGGGFALTGFHNSPFQNRNQAKMTHIFALIGVVTNSVSLVANALTTLLIVTKILLTSREVRLLGSHSHRSLRIVTAVVIESGLLTSAFQLAFVILFSSQSSIPVLEISSHMLTQIYGITPALLHIRIAMGSTHDETTERTRSLRFARSGGATTQVTSPSMAMAGVQSRDINSEINEYISDLNDLREENRRLREENNRLKKGY
ncbi:hypothetical protein BD779DRAFT_1791915 [Infundibulicybe gibba]|nr:hypothetical protein BD779DRAFT_1791915 [Infundibulicybe gibba]